MFIFEDRLGNHEVLAVYQGETIDQVLLRYFIPPSSVIVLCGSDLVSDNSIVDEKQDYTAYLIEGYDISAIRQLYTRMETEKKGGDYQKRQLSLDRDGSVLAESASFSSQEASDYVESVVTDTCKHYSLITEGNGVLVGLSGGVDSSALLMILSKIQRNLPNFRLVAVTFEDYDSQSSPTFTHASTLAKDLGVKHFVASAKLAESIFHLNTPLNVILPKLMYTEMAHFAMYIDHHTTRRTLEVFAEQHGLDRIALGLHTTDLVAGLINGWMTGYQIGNIPLRKYSKVTYIYPLAFIQKKELHIYHYTQTKSYAKHTYPNPWELNPKDRNFYYYLADQLQTYWPRLEVMLYTAHNTRALSQVGLKYSICGNCGAEILNQGSEVLEECDVCQVLRRFGYIQE